MIRIGIIGKTNTGKTTFFNAATSSTEEVSTYPFTTKKPNTATGQVQTLCVCRELDVTDKPRNSTCIDGWRFIPIEVIDLPGLIKGAFEGKGLGTQFLNVVSQADALLHVVDASGGVDAEGKITQDRILRQTNIEGNGRHRGQTRTRLESPRTDRLVQKTSQGLERFRLSSVFGNPSNNLETYCDYCQQDGLGLFRKEFREAS